MITETKDKKGEIFAGIDTHRDTNAIATCDAFGTILSAAEFSTTKAGTKKLISWLFSQGTVGAVGIECTGSYGKNVACAFQGMKVLVLEITRPVKKDRRSKGKSDTLDAQNAAQSARDYIFGGSRESNACVAKDRTSELEEIRTVKSTYDSAIKMRTQSINELKAVVVGAPDSIRESLRDLTITKLVQKCARFHIDTNKHENTVKAVLKGLAQRILSLDEEIASYKEILDSFANKHLTHLLSIRQVGTISAIQILLSAGTNIDRFKNEAAFAAYCGVSPVPASSGMHAKMRLSRAGDRQANSVFHMIAIGRMGHDADTKEYVKKRTAEGKSKKDIIRCLKRYIAREAFRRLKQDLKNFQIAS